jgi:hypothetical protein
MTITGLNATSVLKPLKDALANWTEVAISQVIVAMSLSNTSDVDVEYTISGLSRIESLVGEEALNKIEEDAKGFEAVLVVKMRQSGDPSFDYSHVRVAKASRASITEEHSNGGPNKDREEVSIQQIALAIVCTLVLVLALLLAVVGKQRGWYDQTADTMDSVLGSPGATGKAVALGAGAMEMVYQALWGTAAKMAVYAPRQMPAGETGVVMLRMWSLAEDENSDTSTSPELVRLAHSSDTTDVGIPHGTTVEATLTVLEEDMFELRSKEKATKSFSWHGEMRQLEWSVRTKVGATDGKYDRAVVIEVCWGSNSRELSCDFTIVNLMMTSTNPAFVAAEVPALQRISGQWKNDSLEAVHVVEEGKYLVFSYKTLDEYKDGVISKTARELEEVYGHRVYYEVRDMQPAASFENQVLRSRTFNSMRYVRNT